MKNKGMFGCCFLFLKIKNTKSMFEERGVFLFFVFLVFSKIIFLNNKKMFLLFFYYSNNRLFFIFYFPSFCISLTTFCIFTKVSFI